MCRFLRLFPALLLLAAVPALAFNPPEDSSGGVKLRIEAPAVVERAGAPFAAVMLIENGGTTPVSGRVRLRGVDNWAVDPAEPRPFSAAPGETLRLEATVTPAPDAHNALYALHAEAAFEPPVDGKIIFHAVHMVEMRRPDPPRPDRAAEWAPWPLAGTGEKALLRYPARRVVWQVFGQPPVTTPTDWHGADPGTGAAVSYAGWCAHPDGRPTLVMHPCWRTAPGTMMAEFALKLPTAPARLRFGNAVRDTHPGEPASDGVTFRVRVAPFDAPDGTFGEVAFEQHTDAKTWLPGEADLSPWAGQTVRLQLESHPGPKNDTTCDESHWGDPVLVFPAADGAAQDTPTETLALGTVTCGGHAFPVSVTPGPRGLLNADIRLGDGPSALVCRGITLRVLGDDLADGRGPTELVEWTRESVDGGARFRHRMRRGDTAYDIVADLSVAPDGAALRARLRLENTPPARPWFDVFIEDAALGPLDRAPRDVYAGIGNILREPQDFSLPFDSHQMSTSFVGFDFGDGVCLVQGVDAPPSRLEFSRARSTYSLHAGDEQTIFLIPCADVWDGAANWAEKVDTRPEAPGVKALRGRLALDLWGGNYAPTAAALRDTFARVGGERCVVIFHNWQRWGYDYRLPDIFPPNPEYGTEPDFVRLARTCAEAGALFAPHDNYIDLYPDADGFSYDHVLFSASGDPVRAWLNEYRGAQAYRWDTDAFRPAMLRNLHLLRDFCAPTAYFVDVWSSIGPYDGWTRAGAHQTQTHTRDTWGRAFAEIRDTLGGAPTISEGGHDQLVGWLDGSQCNHLRVDPNPPAGYNSVFTWNITCADAERIPWFDAAYHGRFVAHGAGYDPRYRAGLDPRLHGVYSDDYICSEIMTGHPPMVSDPGGWDVLRKAELFRGVCAMHLGPDRRVARVDFADGDLRRQHVQWTGAPAYETWINRGEADWTVTAGGEPHVLPQYGFLALGDGGRGVRAGITRVDGLVVEWSVERDGARAYCNARSPQGDRAPFRARAVAVTPGEGRAVRAALEWSGTAPALTDWQPFVHFVGDDGEIAFQADHAFPVPATQWTGPMATECAARIPADAAPGTRYEMRGGMYVKGGARAVMAGACDAEQRARLGTVTVTETGFDWAPVEETADPWVARTNPERRIVPFGDLRTNGTLTVEKTEGRWTVTPFPGTAPCTLLFKAQGETPPPTAAALDADGKTITEAPLRREGDAWALDCAPGVEKYQIRPVGG